MARRKKQEALSDPQPGDRVSSENRVRQVLARDGNEVEYESFEQVRGPWRPRTCTVAAWQEWAAGGVVLKFASKKGEMDGS